DFLVAYPSFCNPAQMVKLPSAERSGKGYVLKGDLEYLVLGGIAAQALIPARLEDKSGYSFFLVDLGDKGVKKGDPVFSLGLHACPAVDVTFNTVKAHLIGEEGKGYGSFQAASKKLHVAAAAMSAGILKGTFNEALAYAQERFQGGCQIINWSEVSMILANMAVKADVADLCVAQACQALEKGTTDWGRLCVAAAIHVHELCCEAVNDGVQVLGGNGYMKDYGQEKRYRDARQVQALLGISPMKKISIIREIAGLEDTCAAAF
ncbi:MAG TPA: acyl-CoA dehydrogenase, partial [Desulfomonilia bacterium]|nr:acyl-CoA dehydrogenase [Desulfomonilia bacterium]